MLCRLAAPRLCSGSKWGDDMDLVDRIVTIGQAIERQLPATLGCLTAEQIRAVVTIAVMAIELDKELSTPIS